MSGANEAEFTVFLLPSYMANRVWIEDPAKLNDGFSQLSLDDVAKRAFQVCDHQVICISGGIEHRGTDQFGADLEEWKRAVRSLRRR